MMIKNYMGESLLNVLLSLQLMIKIIWVNHSYSSVINHNHNHICQSKINSNILTITIDEEELYG